MTTRVSVKLYRNAGQWLAGEEPLKECIVNSAEALDALARRDSFADMYPVFTYLVEDKIGTIAEARVLLKSIANGNTVTVRGYPTEQERDASSFGDQNGIDIMLARVPGDFRGKGGIPNVKFAWIAYFDDAGNRLESHSAALEYLGATHVAGQRADGDTRPLYEFAGELF